jgi:hypothetical protein
VARPMWPPDAEVRYAVRATYQQSAMWGGAAGIKGLPVPVFLALAADVYAEHLQNVSRRLQRAAERRRAREAR